MAIPKDVVKISDTIWEIPVTHKGGMRVPARVYATEKLLAEMDEGVFEQVTNVATLPGILGYSFCMPDGPPSTRRRGSSPPEGSAST
jgi:tRNA-splicing ligase RtcB